MLKERFFTNLVCALVLFFMFPLSASAGSNSVVIDPGHGGGDSGAVGPTGFEEKVANLDIGLRVRDLLAKAGYNTIMTRTTDVSPNSPARDLTGDGRINISDDLQARVNIANSAKADVFISIHNNASVSSARGTETYYWNGAGSDSDSARLARFIQEEVKAETGLYDRGVKNANFYVLRRTDMPAALLEGAFISNPTEEQLLRSPDFRQKVAKGIYKGVSRFMGPTGPGPKQISFKIKAHTRRRIDLNKYFRDQAVGQRVTSNRRIAVERASYFNSNSISGGSSSYGVRKTARTWYLAEGFTAPGFDTWILLLNPGGKKTVAKIKYYVDGRVIDGGKVKLPPRSRRSVHVNNRLANRSFATKVRAKRRIVVDRSIYFNSDGRDGGFSSAGIKKPALSWYFANGYTGPQSDTWLLLFNPGKRIAHTAITYIASSGEIVEKPVDIPARSRQSIHVNDETADSNVSMRVLSDANIVAERTVYFTRNGISGANSSAGAIEPKKKWYFADGSTKAGAEEFLTVQNPNEAPATISIDYITTSGTKSSAQKVIPAGGRQTINVRDAAEGGSGKNSGVRLKANLPVVTERSIYLNTSMFKGGSDSLGVTSAARRWLFAEGFTGDGFSTSLMLINTNDKPAKVKVRFFKE